jgi:acyl carrier protein
MSTADKVKELIANQLNKSIEEIGEDKEIVKDLGADSLDVVEMLMAIEEDLDISIPEEEVLSFKTVGDVVTYLENNH